MAAIRYLVDDLEKSISFYKDHLGFKLDQQFGPAMAILSKDDLKLWLAGPMSSAAQPMSDGKKPTPGGWNRFVFQVKGLENLILQMKEKGISFRNEIVKGPGGSQILCLDPSGNLIELFEPKS